MTYPLVRGCAELTNSSRSRALIETLFFPIPARASGKPTPRFFILAHVDPWQFRVPRLMQINGVYPRDSPVTRDKSAASNRRSDICRAEINSACLSPRAYFYFSTGTREHAPTRVPIYTRCSDLFHLTIRLESSHRVISSSTRTTFLTGFALNIKFYFSISNKICKFVYDTVIIFI